jgi:hypothetical protein
VAEASKESEKIDQARATLKARRVYVGNLPQITPPLTDEALKQFVDTAMQETGLSEEAECVVEVWISPEKHFSFVELRTVQEATNALSLNGINMFGSTLRFNRPHDYVPETTLAGLEGGGVVVAAGLGQTGVASVAKIAESSSALVDVYSQAAHAAAALKLASLMQATKKARRVHVGNLPANVGLTTGMLKEFVDAAMIQLLLVVKVGEPVIDTFLSSDGKFGFVEMRTVAEATNALHMSGITFFGRVIRVGRPADYVPLSLDLIAQCSGMCACVYVYGGLHIQAHACVGNQENIHAYVHTRTRTHAHTHAHTNHTHSTSLSHVSLSPTTTPPLSLSLNASLLHTHVRTHTGSGILGNPSDLGVPEVGYVPNLGPDVSCATEVVVIKHMMSPVSLSLSLPLPLFVFLSRTHTLSSPPLVFHPSRSRARSLVCI